MPLAAVNGIDVYFQLHGAGPPLSNNSELVAERMPNATLWVVDGGHMFPVRDRTAFPAVIEFLELTGGES